MVLPPLLTRRRATGNQSISAQYQLVKACGACDAYGQSTVPPQLRNYGMERREEALGRTEFDLSGPALPNQYRLDDEGVFKGERILSRVELVGRFDHTARWCVTSKVPLHDVKGKFGTARITRPLRGRPAATEDAPLGPAIHFISEHYYAEPITNRQLAHLCDISVRSLERYFSPLIASRLICICGSCGCA